MFHPYRDAPQPEPRGAFDLVRDAFPTAASVEISFSGGNDEGGPDEMRALDARGRHVGTLSEYEEHPWEVFELDAEGAPVMEKVKTDFYPHEYGREKIAEQPAGLQYASAATSLVAPIDARYGSWAGEAYITGTLTWDLATGRFEMVDEPSY